MNNVLEDSLLQIKNDLKAHHRRRDEVLYYFIQKRLFESLKSYDIDMKKSLEYLSKCDGRKMLRRLNKG